MSVKLVNASSVLVHIYSNSCNADNDGAMITMSSAYMMSIDFLPKGKTDTLKRLLCVDAILVVKSAYQLLMK